MQQPTQTYCAARLAKYGITEEFNNVTVPYIAFNAEKGNTTYQKRFTIFKPNEDDGIDIYYLDLNGHLRTWRKEGNKWPKEYIRKRLNPAKAPADQKYDQEKGSGVHMHLNPQIIKKFQDKTPIETLFLVEGEFKGWLGFMHGLDIVGVPSINAYKEKGIEELHEQLQLIISNCQVQNLVMIYDADLLSINWEKWEKNEDYDLGKKLNNFYRSAINIRDFARKLVKDVYLCHIDTSFLNEQIEGETVKGLDDLLLFHKGREKEVVDELLKLRSSRKMFSYINISVEGPAKIREYFDLNKDGKPPQNFYTKHQSRIEKKEFVFLGFRFQYSQKEEGLIIVRHPDSERFIRVACDYMKVIEIPESIRGIKVTRRKLEPWKSGELTRDYVQKGYKNFFDTIQKYDQFTVFPDNTPKYKQVIDNCYNLYYPVKHIPTEGEFPTIEMFLNHLFAEHYTMALDYLTILYLMPFQPLPIIALVSEERGTGKTKFLELLREMFCENTTILGNDAITDNYNDDYASKLVIGIDEGLIEKKATVEKIKSWSTATRIKMNTKFMSRQEIPFYGKIIITSNNVDSFIQIEDQETRFWIRKVNPVGKEDPDLMLKMENEIPAFLHFLKSRSIVHPKETRTWFNYALLKTEALTEIKEASRSWIEKELKSVFEEQFFKYQYHCLPYTLTEIMDVLNGHTAAVKFRKSEVQKTLDKKFRIKSQYYRPEFPRLDVDNFTQSTEKKANGRYYNLFIEDFVPAAEITGMGYDLEKLSEIHEQMRKQKICITYWPNREEEKSAVDEVLKGMNTEEEHFPFK